MGDDRGSDSQITFTQQPTQNFGYNNYSIGSLLNHQTPTYGTSNNLNHPEAPPPPMQQNYGIAPTQQQEDSSTNPFSLLDSSSPNIVGKKESLNHSNGVKETQ